VNVANRGLESRLDPQIDLFIFNSRPARSQTQSFCKVIIGDYGATTMRLSRSLFGVPSEYQQLRNQRFRQLTFPLIGPASTALCSDTIEACAFDYCSFLWRC
jgi:hypothetical protein